MANKEMESKSFQSLASSILSDDNVKPHGISRKSLFYLNENEDKEQNRSDSLHSNMEELLKSPIDITQFNLMNRFVSQIYVGENNLEVNAKELEDYIDFIKILLSNSLALDRHTDMNCRIDLMQALRKMFDDVTESYELSNKKYKIVKQKWNAFRDVATFEEIFEKIDKLKSETNQIIANKDELVQQAFAELNTIQEKFFLKISNYSKHLKQFIERLEALHTLLKSALENHIEVLHLDIAEQQNKRLRNTQQNFGILFCNSKDSREALKEITDQNYQNLQENIERMNQQEQAKTKAVTNRLNTIYDNLQLEFRQLRNESEFNWQKYDWNCMVMKSREEENHFVLNQQKKRIHTMVDSIISLRKKQKIVNKASQDKISKLQARITRLHASISVGERQNIFYKKKLLRDFVSMWRLYYKEAQDEIHKIMNIQRILYEQLLNIKWQPPNFEIKPLKFITDTDSPINKSKKSQSSLRPQSSQDNRKQASTALVPLTDVNLRKVRFIRNVLRQISDSMGNLVEQRLLHFLSAGSQKTQTLLRVEYVFNMLQVNNIQDLHALADVFKGYAKCPYCSRDISPAMLEKFIADNKIVRFSKYLTTEDNCPKHILLVEPSTVLTALCEFRKKSNILITQYNEEKRNEQKKDEEIHNIIEMLPQAAEILEFWHDVITFIPPSTSSFWDKVGRYQMVYYRALKERKTLNIQCKSLRQQNNELKYLLSNRLA